MPFNRITAAAIALPALGHAYIIYMQLRETRKNEQRHAELEYLRDINRIHATWAYEDGKQPEAERLKHGPIPKPQELIDFDRSGGHDKLTNDGWLASFITNTNTKYRG